LIAQVAEDADERRALLHEAEAALASGCVGHNYLEFYDCAIEACLRSKEWDEADRYARALEKYTRPQPLRRCSFTISRARAPETALASA